MKILIEPTVYILVIFTAYDILNNCYKAAKIYFRCFIFYGFYHVYIRYKSSNFLEVSKKPLYDLSFGTQMAHF